MVLMLILGGSRRYYYYYRQEFKYNWYSSATKDIHVDRNENENNRRVSSYPQSITSESLAANMTQQIEMRAIGQTTEMTRRNL